MINEIAVDLTMTQVVDAGMIMNWGYASQMVREREGKNGFDKNQKLKGVLLILENY